MTTCPICNLRPGQRMCRPCTRSYEATLGGDVWSVIEWAARRARWFAKREKRERRSKR